MLKYCAFFSLCAGLGLAADFVTGQAARLVIGQQTFTNQLPGASDTLLGAAGGLAFAGDTLFVADANRVGLTPLNNRILLFKNSSASLPGAAAPIPPNSGSCPVCTGQAQVVVGQPDFTSSDFHISQTGLRLPTGVASDGQHLAVADTSNNRVLLWNSIPTANGQPADIVLGQSDFNSLRPVVVDAKSFRAPQGVWLQNGKFYVADTQNHRVLIWNSIPTQNDQPADLVLGQPNFSTAPEPDLTKAALNAQANTLLNPVAVTSDGTHLFVTDLGHNRVMIWNSIPTQTQQPADVEIGQKDFQSATANDTTNLCASNGTDSNNNPTYPKVCGKTLNFPRFALSDGTRLYIADGGNDRVLIFNTIPTQNSPAADVILGQPDEFTSVVTSNSDLFTPNLKQSGADVTPTPTSLAWDGTNLYVADPSDRRVLVFTPGQITIPINSVRNAASLEIFALGSVTLAGTIQADDTVTVTVNGTDYTYKIVKDDTIDKILQALANMINGANNGAGDPNVLARPELGFSILRLVARKGGDAGNSITLTTKVSTNAMITATASGATLSGGKSAATIAPGTLVTIQQEQGGANLADTSAAADPNANGLPMEWGGVQVYFDGIRAPLLYVSPTQINAQMPFEVNDRTSTSAFVRLQHSNGDVSVTNAVGVPIVQQNPGLFAEPGSDPRHAIAFHASSYATGTISVDGTINANDVATINIEDRSYSYTVQSGDTLASVRDALIAAINANPEEKVVAYPAAAFTRIRLRAKVPGPDGNGIPITASVSSSAQVILTATNSALCCANVAGSRITPDNPAVAGENIYIYATGLGIVQPDDAKLALATGYQYLGPALNDPNSSVSSLAGGRTANVLSAGMMVGATGVYQVVLELNTGIPTDPETQVTISQDIYTSNIVTIPVFNPTPSSP